MRRSSSVALLAAVLGILVVTWAVTGGVPTHAAEGDPDDYCSHAPDQPLGWLFTDACRGHDECLADVDHRDDRDARLGCDDDFLDALLEAPSVFTGRLCAESAVCDLLARIYHGVVRLVTLLFFPAQRVEGGPGSVDAHNARVLDSPHFWPVEGALLRAA